MAALLARRRCEKPRALRSHNPPNPSGKAGLSHAVLALAVLGFDLAAAQIGGGAASMTGGRPPAEVSALHAPLALRRKLR